MIIVYNADERFAEIFATSVVSLFENNQDVADITVYLIENHISNESKEKFQQLAVRYGRKIITLPMPDIEKLVGVNVVIPQYNRMATCGRLFIASLLPDNIDKVIYVDSDTIFVDSIEKIWATDISGHAVGMTDCPQNMSFRTQLDLSKEGVYCNSGLLLINLKKWREINAEKKFLAFMRSQGGYVPFPDEGVLNAVFDGDILLLPLRYNVMTHILAFTYQEMCYARGVKTFYTQEEFNDAREHPVMVHFTSNFYFPERPWMQGCKHPYAEKYREYRLLTPWKEKPLWNDERPKTNKLYTKFCHAVPKPLAVWSAHIISLYLIPLKHRRAKKEALRRMRAIADKGGKEI